MAKKKIDPQVQRMMESFNRKPTAAEEADFYKRNAGGPLVMTSLTRGRGYLGNFGEPDAHIAAYRSHELAEYFDRQRDERRRTFHEAHIDAYWIQWSYDFLARQKHPHTTAIPD